MVDIPSPKVGRYKSYVLHTVIEVMFVSTSILRGKKIRVISTFGLDMMKIF